MHIAQTSRVGFSIKTMEDFSSMSDEELLAFSMKRPSVFEFLMARYQNQFLSRAQAVVRSRDAAEDIVQDAFVRIYRFAPNFDAKAGNFRSWALTILMNVARTQYQKNAKERGYVAPLDPDHYESLGDASIPDKEGHEGYAREVIERALSNAPKDAAEILRLAFIEDLPYKDIARKIGLSVPAVKTRVHRAKKVLAEILNAPEYQ